MNALSGPFVPDRNISVATFSFEDRIWIIFRRALHDTSSTLNLGVLEISGVRDYRSREIDEKELTNLMEGVEANFWAIDLGVTDFLAQSLMSERHPVADPSLYHHFLMMNGWDHVIEVIGKKATYHALPDDVSLNLKDFFSGDLDRLIPIQ